MLAVRQQWCEEMVEHVHAHRRGAPAWFELAQYHPGTDVEGHADSWRVPPCVSHSIRQWCQDSRLDEIVETKPFSDPLAFRGPATRYGQPRGAPFHRCRNGDCFLFSSRVRLMGGSTAGLRGIYSSAEPSDTGVATGDRGLEDDSNKDGAALPQSIVDRRTTSQ